MYNFSIVLFFISLFFAHTCAGHTGLAAVDHPKKKIKKHAATTAQQKSSEKTYHFDNTSIKKIRVLIEEIPTNKQKKIILKSDNGFVLESPSGSGTTALFQEKDLCVSHKNNQMYLKCKDQQYRRIKNNNIEICNSSNQLNVNGTDYQGSITLILDEKNNRVLMINTLDLEDYVFSVLRSEGIPSWPMDMLKIQAIASRTFAVFSMRQAGKKNKNPYYDIKNTNHCQIYQGLHNFKHLRKATDETRGVILTYNNKPALAMFDICCGGVIPGHLRHRDKSKPYLLRTHRCTHCSNASFYRWKEDVHHHTFLEQLKQHPRLKHKFKDFGNKITDIQIIDKDKAGLVHKVKVIGPKKQVTLAGKDLKNGFKRGMKSAAFSVKKIKDRIVATGNGYGHHTGLCQRGAKTLVDNGWHYKKILNFYYPNTKLATLI